MKSFDNFANSIRRQVNINNNNNNQTTLTTTEEAIPSQYLHRKMKFVKNNQKYDETSNSMIHCLENYIYDTKDLLNEQLPQIFCQQSRNLKSRQKAALKSLKNCRNTLTIKPADKNLGIVLMNTEDYTEQCLKHLATPTYHLVSEFPKNLKNLLENTLSLFRTELTNNILFSRNLYCHLLPEATAKYRTPRFYGLPKIHKPHHRIPPVRPIVSQTNSLLSLTAKFLDHVLQPLARSYPDYLHNSTCLINILSNMTIPKDATLITMDVVNLFPSIPQDECLDIIQQELRSHPDLLIFDPNLIMNLIQIHMKNNYFEFSDFVFHQTTGIAMGAAFSPTVANIFMSVFFRRFLSTTQEHPILLVRYIDDIFLIWPSHSTFLNFKESLDSFHPNIKFTAETSTTTVNFLDITIYKNNPPENNLQIKTFQKSNNYNSHGRIDTICKNKLHED